MSPNGVSDSDLVDQLFRRIHRLQQVQSRWRCVATSTVFLAFVGFLLAAFQFVVVWHTLAKLKEAREESLQLYREAEQSRETVRETQTLFSRSEAINAKLDARIMQLLEYAEELVSVNEQLMRFRREVLDQRRMKWLEANK